MGSSSQRFAQAGALLGLLFGGCKSEGALRRDDLSAVTGAYERPHLGVHGMETATLTVTQDGMTFEDEPYRETLRFEHSACDASTSCTIRGVACEASLEKRADGNLVVVSGDRRCEAMAGTWYTKENASAAADELARAAPRPIASASSPVASALSAAPADAELTLPPDDSEPSGKPGCVQRCNQAAVACTKACKPSDKGCVPRCSEPMLACAASCPGR